MLTLPGRQPASFEADTDSFHYRIYGQHPVQAEGFVAGHPFYFRAKWDFWDFTVCTSHDFPDAGSSLDPPDDCQGFFQDGEYLGYHLSQRHGQGTDASYLTVDEARAILEPCLRRFLRGCCADGQQAPL